MEEGKKMNSLSAAEEEVGPELKKETGADGAGGGRPKLDKFAYSCESILSIASQGLNRVMRWHGAGVVREVCKILSLTNETMGYKGAGEGTADQELEGAVWLLGPKVYRLTEHICIDERRVESDND